MAEWGKTPSSTKAHAYKGRPTEKTLTALCGRTTLHAQEIVWAERDYGYMTVFAGNHVETCLNCRRKVEAENV